LVDGGIYAGIARTHQATPIPGAAAASRPATLCLHRLIFEDPPYPSCYQTSAQLGIARRRYLLSARSARQPSQYNGTNVMMSEVGWVVAAAERVYCQGQDKIVVLRPRQ
jgi:hypothetical protein